MHKDKNVPTTWKKYSLKISERIDTIYEGLVYVEDHCQEENTKYGHF